jgi:hypothetical protein
VAPIAFCPLLLYNCAESLSDRASYHTAAQEVKA